jgi:peptidoglycan/LPS O-acetylase OafA/YrhL
VAGCIFLFNTVGFTLEGARVATYALVVNSGLVRTAVGFSLGCVVFRLQRQFFNFIHLRVRLFVLPTLTLGLLTWVAINYNKPYMAGSDYAVVLIVFPLLILGTIDKETFLNRLLGNEPLEWLGLLSYSIYLIQLPLFWCFQWTFRVSGIDLGVPWNGVLYLCALLVLSALTYQYIERPWRRRMRNFLLSNHI